MFRTEALAEAHYLATFTCGNDDLDRWLKNAALTSGRAGNSRTYVWLLDTDEVAAYFAIAPTAVKGKLLPPKLAHGAPEFVPGFLLAKLALHQQFRGERVSGVRFGEVLLMSALRVILESAAAAGGRVVVVDAIDERAIQFYQRNRFRLLSPESDRLALKMSTAAELVGLPWPP